MYYYNSSAFGSSSVHSTRIPNIITESFWSIVLLCRAVLFSPVFVVDEHARVKYLRTIRDQKYYDIHNMCIIM